MTEQFMQNQKPVSEGQVQGDQPGVKHEVLGNQMQETQAMPTMQEGMKQGQTQNQPDLPGEAQNLPIDAQHIFQAAMSAAQRDGMSEEGAKEVAWNSVCHKYVEINGEWQRKPEDVNQHFKSIQNAGN